MLGLLLYVLYIKIDTYFGVSKRQNVSGGGWLGGGGGGGGGKRELLAGSSKRLSDRSLHQF